jgi:hypothetical protein
LDDEPAMIRQAGFDGVARERPGVEDLLGHREQFG